VTDHRPDDDLAEWDAAYVLGALNPDERRTYENYLATNPQRSAEVTELAGIPDILDVLSPEEALALTDLGDGPAAQDRPDNVTPLARAERQRQSRRARFAGVIAVAAALAIVGGVVGATVFPRTTESVQTVAMAPMQPGSRPGLTAQLAVTEKKWGTELNWACEYTKDWARDVESYDIVVTTRDGGQMVVGSWRPAGDEATGLSAATSVPTSEIRTVDIRVSGTDEPLAVTTL
jgi:anti-sigma factor RsiW